MNKKTTIPLIVVTLILFGVLGFLTVTILYQRKVTREVQELAELDKQEMQSEYELFTRQYGEMMKQVNNDSLVAQLTREQLRAQELLEELNRVKDNDAREIARLKKELATVREVLRSYILEIDSLNSVNQSLTMENTRIKGQYEEAERQILGLNSEKASLTEQITIAAQLDASNITLTLKKKNSKTTTKLKDTKTIEVSFTIARNPTTETGVKMFYIRITSPTGTVVGSAGKFTYENKQIDYSMMKSLEYRGEETSLSAYCTVSEYLSAGTYTVSIFADGNMIGSKTYALK